MSEKSEFPIIRLDYKLLLTAFGLILLGLVMISGGGSETPDRYDPDVFSFRRLFMAPVLLLAGYIVCIIAIMKKHREE